MWVYWVLGGLLFWLLLALVVGVIFGKSIRLADRGGVSNRAKRFQRRLAERRTQQRVEEARALKHPLGDPRSDDDRRQVERRSREMTPQEVEDWLKRNGILGGDRRRGQRRTGDRRRR